MDTKTTLKPQVIKPMKLGQARLTPVECQKQHKETVLLLWQPKHQVAQCSFRPLVKTPQLVHDRAHPTPPQ